MTYAETVPSVFLLQLKMVQRTVGSRIQKTPHKKLTHSTSEKTVDKTIGYCSKTIGSIQKAVSCLREPTVRETE